MPFTSLVSVGSQGICLLHGHLLLSLVLCHSALTQVG